jgi:hypothetical protein
MKLPNFNRAVNQSRRMLGIGCQRVVACSRDLLERSKHLMEWVVPDPAACRQTAQKLRGQHPALTPRQLAHLHIRSTQKNAARVGGATGILAGPWAMLTAALGDTAYMLKLEGQMAGELAALLDPASLDDPDTFRADILAIVFPSAASQALRAATNLAAASASRALVRRFMSRQLTDTAARFAVRRLSRSMVEHALTKAVPLAGIALGARWNWLEARRVGHRAVTYYTQPDTPTAGTTPVTS